MKNKHKRKFDFMMIFPKYRKLKRKLAEITKERNDHAEKLRIQLKATEELSKENQALRNRKKKTKNA